MQKCLLCCRMREWICARTVTSGHMRLEKFRTESDFCGAGTQSRRRRKLMLLRLPVDLKSTGAILRRRSRNVHLTRALLALNRTAFWSIACHISFFHWDYCSLLRCCHISSIHLTTIMPMCLGNRKSCPVHMYSHCVFNSWLAKLKQIITSQPVWYIEISHCSSVIIRSLSYIYEYVKCWRLNLHEEWTWSRSADVGFRGKGRGFVVYVCLAQGYRAVFCFKPDFL